MPRVSTAGQLLAAGIASIHAHGFAATGVQEITAAAGVPKGSFYNHFPSKAAFGLAVLDAYWDGAASTLDLLAEPGRPVPERLTRHFRAVQAWLRGSGQDCGCLLGNFAIEAPSAGPEIRARVDAIFARLTAALAECLREGAAEGTVRRDIAPEDLAHLLLAAFQGCVQRGKVQADASGFDIFHRVMQRIIAG